MCIIMYNESGQMYDKEQLSNAITTNDDGVGLMWRENGKVRTFKALMKRPQFLELMERFVGVPHALHLRMATHGGVKKELCHPFRASHDEADKHVWIMHNGVIGDTSYRPGESDTLAFSRELQELSREWGPDCLFEDENVAIVEGRIGGHNKVVMLSDDGQVAILNPDAWYVDKETGIWYSNQYSLKRSWSSYGSYGNYGDMDDDDIAKAWRTLPHI